MISKRITCKSNQSQLFAQGVEQCCSKENCAAEWFSSMRIVKGYIIHVEPEFSYWVIFFDKSKIVGLLTKDQQTQKKRKYCILYISCCWFGTPLQPLCKISWKKWKIYWCIIDSFLGSSSYKIQTFLLRTLIFGQNPNLFWHS